ncbi:MAG: xanthine phosphoribosyltransferase [Alphaproteobacteria bacterium]|nr:xanthine phosphoribosyltransferase [Alphaproteobacteria bacterium]
MNSAQKIFPVSWEEMHRDAKALAWRLLEHGPWKGLVIITRGGLVPGAVVARELNIRIIESVSVSGYNTDDTKTDKHRETKILKFPSDIGDGSGWLVIDDLVDTGGTIELVKNLLPKAHYAAVYAKPLGKPLVDSYVTEVSQDTWICFPWESLTELPMALRDKN